MTVQVVWYKRDLRTFDHAPLSEAVRRGPVVPLSIVEPGLWRLADISARHRAFLGDNLEELRDDLAALGQPLIVRVGEAIPVLDELRRAHGSLAL